ncbi:sulfite exporter TauE/SafE family protein [Candidatus Kaiserbacteria bacterium]|nr:sulfite exporter TauE/SafE family protein [Candidatus Kaiserbacteria bacterium]
MKTYTLHVSGMHCKACPTLIESELNDLPEVSHAKASLKHANLEISGDFGDKTQEHIARDLTEVLRPHGYLLSIERHKHAAKWSEFKIAVPIALVFAVLFVALQNLGIVNLVNSSAVSYGTAFAIGIIASLSTCMAVVGGLVLSMSATFAKEGDRVRPQLLFHAGRLVSFFALGGVLGAVGTMFALNTTATFILGLIIAAVMLILGINLLDVFHWSRRLQPSMPRFLARHMLGITEINHTLTPFLVGVGTFFLPCGFTQSMQIYALSTGSFLTGALTMGSFALGTLPVLALISFSSFSIRNRAYSGVFFKTAGLIVILFAFVNLMNALAVAGLIVPLFSF